MGVRQVWRPWCESPALRGVRGLRGRGRARIKKDLADGRAPPEHVGLVGRPHARAVMNSTRLEAFSDGVIAIIITIMVLELKAPHAPSPEELLALWPTFLSYVMSYVMVAIYWLNHHRLFHLAKPVDTRILWANILLLFCLSLVPFSTAYAGENRLSPFATAVYAAVLLLCALAYLVLIGAI